MDVVYNLFGVTYMQAAHVHVFSQAVILHELLKTTELFRSHLMIIAMLQHPVGNPPANFLYRADG